MANRVHDAEVKHVAGTEITWERELKAGKGETKASKAESKKPFLRVQTKCSCGCDDRGGDRGVGYVIGMDAKGRGFTIWIRDDETMRRFKQALRDSNGVIADADAT